MVNYWSLHVDRSMTLTNGEASLVLRSPDGEVYKHALRFNFRATNNEVKYKALLTRLKLDKSMEIESLKIFCDS